MASNRKDRLACALALAVLPAGPALAEPRSLDIPSEEAAKSIPEFARQENIQIIAPVSQLHGIKTQAVSGRMELGEALKRALTMPLAERKQRWETLNHGVRTEDVTAWRKSFVAALEATRGTRASAAAG